MAYQDLSRAVGPFKFLNISGHHNRVAIIGSCALIALPSGHHAIIDACDLERVSGHKWRVRKTGNPENLLLYAVSSTPYALMHRIILGIPKGFCVDHINSNGLDNRRTNLRRATHAQNMANRRKARHGLSPFKGVKRDISRRKSPWRAELRVNGKRYRGPWRSCHYVAAMDYDLLSKRHHGDFSRCNKKDAPGDEAEGQ
jgi:hypothetical protein